MPSFWVKMPAQNDTNVLITAEIFIVYYVIFSDVLSVIVENNMQS